MNGPGRISGKFLEALNSRIDPRIRVDFAICIFFSKTKEERTGETSAPGLPPVCDSKRGMVHTKELAGGPTVGQARDADVRPVQPKRVHDTVRCPSRVAVREADSCAPSPSPRIPRSRATWTARHRRPGRSRSAFHCQ